MSQQILLKVQNYLAELSKKRGTDLTYSAAGVFGEAVIRSARRQLSPDKEKAFTLRMSNLGRPGCVLQAEKYEHKREPEPYSNRFRNLYGDLIEQTAVLIMRQAGVNVVSEQGGVKLGIGGANIEGTYDVKIAEPDEKVYDVKSASGWVFRNKYLNKNLLDIWKDGDTFGYVSQLYGYSQALKVPVGGIIAISKETGEWAIVPPPTSDDELRELALRRAATNVERLNSDAPFRRDFEPVEEFYRKKPTGNRVLPFQCTNCPFRISCWPDAKCLPQVVSGGEHPREFWYTHIDDKYKEKQDG